MVGWMTSSASIVDSAVGDPSILQFCEKLPKIELHAHLNGSVSKFTCRQLVAELGIEDITASDLELLNVKGDAFL